MEIRNFLFMAKKAVKFVLVSAFLFGCATKKPAPVVAERPKNPTVYTDKETKPTEEKPETSAPQEGAPVVTAPQEGAPVAAPVEASSGPVRAMPRIGLIFSAGGAKAWGHIGVIKEIEKAKWPVRAVAGLEWGAAVAASYAHQLSSNEVEWELSKVRNLEDVEQASETIFRDQSVTDLKVPFVCPSLNIVKQEIFLLNRGQLAKLMPFCVAAAGSSAPYNQSVGVLDHITALARHIRATGVKKVILINVLAQGNKRSYMPDNLSAENILWVKAAIASGQKPAGVDDVIQIDLGDYSIKDLDRKREIIARAAELSYDQVKKLSTKYGL
jgi:NTE family protein